MKFDENTTLQQSQDALNYLKQLFGELAPSNNTGVIPKTTLDEFGNPVNTEFYNNMQYYLNEMIQFNTANGTSTIEYPASIRLIKEGDKVQAVNINGGQFIIDKDENGNYLQPSAQEPEDILNENGEVIGQITYTVTSGVTNNNGEYSFTYNYTYPDETGTMVTTTGICKFSDDPENPAATTTEVADAYETAETVKEIYQYFQQNYLNNIDRSKFGYLAPTQQTAFNAAAEELARFIFGDDFANDILPEDYDKLDDMAWLVDKAGTTNLDDATPTTIMLEQNINGTFTNVPYTANFEAIKDIYLVEQMIAQFGAPKYTWIDVNNPNENADAKAQWYTNLFEKMQESGYQKIEAGLTKSPEWIQYALESGLLSMVQVNDEYQWVSTMYSNCSDITEDTIEIEITRAEAEYKRETQKIQAKDKRFDMELKNIDTEHNSLQSEYDSIKSVIDKNVQRHFKLFA